MRAVESGNSEGKDGTMTVELHSHKKSRRGEPIPYYYPYVPLPNPPILSSAIVIAFVCELMRIISEDAQKSHTKVEGRESGGWY